MAGDLQGSVCPPALGYRNVPTPGVYIFSKIETYLNGAFWETEGFWETNPMRL